MSGKHRIEPICQISMRSSIQGASTKIVHNSVQAPMTGAIICIAQGVTFASTSTQSD
ncbi:hypothetical protein BRADI_1g73804v3 [Brachypodium distachyon]|uniref:Uncharacterized protein n=1 Tax=Brachypodium distachyon TaxID=15368 RepID=A0A2K2DV14_BRADI|nr:hypothetical protein BRADI_1g73804v3 [Brachypodium distachyon]